MKKRNVWIFFFLFFINSTIWAQKSQFGLNYFNEWSNGKINAGFGLNYNYKVTDKIGLYVGLNFRPSSQTLQIDYISEQYTIHVLESYLSFPLLIKYDFSYFNLLIGPSADVFLNWNQVYCDGIIEITDYAHSNKVFGGLLLKASKEITICEKWKFAPELSFNAVSGLKRLYAGFGFQLYYQFSK